MVVEWSGWGEKGRESSREEKKEACWGVEREDARD